MPQMLQQHTTNKTKTTLMKMNSFRASTKHEKVLSGFISMVLSATVCNSFDI